MTTELRRGRWQDALADVECDALIVDAPYSERCHSAHNIATENRPDRAGRVLSYDHWTPADVAELVGSWSGRTSGWMVSITDHVLATAWADEMSAAGRYVFAPLPYVEVGSRVRLLGDGPSSWTTWIVVSRPRRAAFMKWGALPGAYVLPHNLGDADRKKWIVGGKPLWLMRQLVCHYSTPGMRIADPCAGAATTLVAARLEGRSSIGSEETEVAYALGTERIASPYTPSICPDETTVDAQRPLLPSERQDDV